MFMLTISWFLFSCIVFLLLAIANADVTIWQAIGYSLCWPLTVPISIICSAIKALVNLHG